MNEYLHLLLNGLEQDQAGIDQRHGYWSEQSLRCAARIQRLRVQLGIESEYEWIEEGFLQSFTRPEQDRGDE